MEWEFQMILFDLFTRINGNRDELQYISVTEKDVIGLVNHSSVILSVNYLHNTESKTNPYILTLNLV